jgi:hypothetical protein
MSSKNFYASLQDQDDDNPAASTFGWGHDNDIQDGLGSTLSSGTGSITSTSDHSHKTELTAGSSTKSPRKQRKRKKQKKKPEGSVESIQELLSDTFRSFSDSITAEIQVLQSTKLIKHPD